MIYRNPSLAWPLRGSPSAGAGLKDLGVHQLKGAGRSEKIFQLQAGGLLAAFCCDPSASRRC